jgi:VWFA-related protein
MAFGQPVIRVTTRLVDVSVIARDAKGPAAGLTKEDFKVFDNGVERPIAFFSVNSVRPPAEAPVKALPPNVFTNRAEERTDAPERLTVFVIDGLNTDFGAQARVRQQFVKYAREIGPRDRAAVWVMTDRLRRIQDFTNDGARLAAAVESVRPNIWLSSETTSAIAGRQPSSDGEAFMIREANRSEEMMQYYRMQLTNDLLKELAEALAKIPGRKNMVWLSSAFPVNMSIGPGGPERSFGADRLTGTGRAIAQANVALYPVDARGLVAPQGGQSAMAVSIAERDRHESMEIIAAATGGRAIYDNNDLSAAMREAVEDAEVTYTIGFYPEDSADDRDQRRVRIDVKRPGVSLRYRNVYLSATPPEINRREEIHDALTSPLDAAAIPITVRLEPVDPKAPGWTHFTVVMPNGAMAEGSEFDLVVAQRAADGRDLATVGEVDTFHGPAKLYRRVLRKAGVQRIRVVAYDRASGRVGSVDLPAPRP